MTQAAQRLERSIKARRQSDELLINWWLYVLLLVWITFGLFGLYIFFRRMSRVDRFVNRKRDYYSSLIDLTEQSAMESGRLDGLHPQIEDLRSQLKEEIRTRLKPIGAGLHTLLLVVTAGLWGFYSLYRLNRAWMDFQEIDQEFHDSLSQIWQRLEILNYPLAFDLDTSKRRSYAMYLILSVVTFGIVGLVWDYKIHTDPDDLYPEFHTLEDTVLQAVRNYKPVPD